MASSTPRSTGTPIVAMAACAVFLTAVLCAGVRTGSANVAGQGTTTRLASTTAVSVPPAVQTDLDGARADLAKLDVALAAEEKQQKDAKSELANLEKDVKDDTVPTAMGGTAGPSGADEVSAAIARMFGSHAREYASLAAEVSALHQAFVQTLTAAGSASQAAEAARPTP
jgi:hypothetical protein